MSTNVCVSYINNVFDRFLRVYSNSVSPPESYVGPHRAPPSGLIARDLLIFYIYT